MMDGIVNDRERFIAGEQYIMYSAPTVGGNSGGPLFNAHGEVIGMVTLGQKDGALMNYAIPTSVLKAFIREAERKEGVLLPQFKIRCRACGQNPGTEPVLPMARP